MSPLKWVKNKTPQLSKSRISYSPVDLAYHKTPRVGLSATSGPSLSVERKHYYAKAVADILQEHGGVGRG